MRLLAIEPEIADGVFSGRSRGTLKMREAKVTRLNEWLAVPPAGASGGGRPA